MKTLGAFRNQFEKFDQLIDQTQRSLNAAANKTNALKDRSRMVQDKLKKIEVLEPEADAEIRFTNSEEDYFLDDDPEENEETDSLYE